MLPKRALALILALTAPWPDLALGADCAADRVEVRTAAGDVRRFRVEIADDFEERARGLMFRRHLDPDAGMLFIYDKPLRVAFWMKNTLIPLDMIFADADGVVRRVHAEAVPGSLESIDGGEGVKAVLEIGGGLARELGIGPGAVMRHPAFGPGAAWPCDAG